MNKNTETTTKKIDAKGKDLMKAMKPIVFKNYRKQAKEIITRWAKTDTPDAAGMIMALEHMVIPGNRNDARDIVCNWVASRTN